MTVTYLINIFSGRNQLSVAFSKKFMRKILHLSFFMSRKTSQTCRMLSAVLSKLFLNWVPPFAIVFFNLYPAHNIVPFFSASSRCITGTNRQLDIRYNCSSPRFFTSIFLMYSKFCQDDRRSCWPLSVPVVFNFEQFWHFWGTPDIQCDADSISILFKTSKPFSGKTFVKGFIQDSNCVQVSNASCVLVIL